MGDIGNIPENEQFINRYDNSNLVESRDIQDIMGAYTKVDEVRARKEYLEMLQLEAEMSQSDKVILQKKEGTDGKIVYSAVMVKDLVQQPSEFEMTRRQCIQVINGLKDSQLKQLYSDFETDSQYELSSKIANYLLTKDRKERITDTFNFTDKWHATAEAAREEAKKPRA